jgi:hypothetical protein
MNISVTVEKRFVGSISNWIAITNLYNQDVVNECIVEITPNFMEDYFTISLPYDETLELFLNLRNHITELDLFKKECYFQKKELDKIPWYDFNKPRKKYFFENESSILEHVIIRKIRKSYYNLLYFSLRKLDKDISRKIINNDRQSITIFESQMYREVFGPDREHQFLLKYQTERGNRMFRNEFNLEELTKSVIKVNDRDKEFL